MKIHKKNISPENNYEELISGATEFEVLIENPWGKK
ncbi:hypothetical protein CLV91_1721 [Maribacter vaceletii]|uniref:Uncharacterized protein n=1 Tax=Maribacter vaceletii TaxID=1206816 RepID=A0A495EAV0_9FLAO|nr:hypothetical protein CLV91_1721 [Maribacter vaceletii]